MARSSRAPEGRVRPLRVADAVDPAWIGTGSRRCPASRRPTPRSSASTPRRPGWRRRPGPLAFLVGLGWWEGATASGRSSCCSPTTPTNAALLDALAAAHPGRRLAGHLQRPRVRLAAARRALPARPPRRARPRRPPRPAAARPPRLPPPDDGRAAADSRGGAAGPAPGRRRRGLGDPGPVPRLPAGGSAGAARRRRPPQRPGRPVARPAARPPRHAPRAIARAAPRHRPATSPGWPARSPASTASARRSTASRHAADRADRGARGAADPRHRPSPPHASRDDDPWWSPRRPADFGGRPDVAGRVGRAGPDEPALDAPWTTERIAVDRAHLLRRLGRTTRPATRGPRSRRPGGSRVVAWDRVAKLREHRLRDRDGRARGASPRPRARSNGGAGSGVPEPRARGGPRRRAGAPRRGSARDGQRRSTAPTWVTSLGRTARRTRSHASRTMTPPGPGRREPGPRP